MEIQALSQRIWAHCFTEASGILLGYGSEEQKHKNALNAVKHIEDLLRHEFYLEEGAGRE